MSVFRQSVRHDFDKKVQKDLYPKTIKYSTSVTDGKTEWKVVKITPWLLDFWKLQIKRGYLTPLLDEEMWKSLGIQLGSEWQHIGNTGNSTWLLFARPLNEKERVSKQFSKQSTPPTSRRHSLW